MLWTGANTIEKILNTLGVSITGTAGAGYLQIPNQSAAPANADAGTVRLYPDANGNWRMVSATGVVSYLGDSAGNAPGFMATRKWYDLAVTSSQWTSVAWSPLRNKFVAVAEGGITNSVMYSSDGVTWTDHASANNSATWNSVTVNPAGRFVAVGRKNAGAYAAMYSDDGINWTGVNFTGEGNEWASVCWASEVSNGIGGFGLFVAVAQTGTNKVMSSRDGINWTPGSSVGDSNGWWSVAWSPTASGTGLFVAVAGSGSNRVMYSPDGINWTLHASAGESSSWFSVCWSPTASGTGKFVAVSNNNGGGMTSTDGISWALSSLNSAASWVSAIWVPALSMFVAGGSATKAVAVSPDGISWREVVATSANWQGMCWSPELRKIVAVAAVGTSRAMST